MITPQKHMNLDGSVLRVAALMVREIARRRSLEVEVLRKRIAKKTGSDTELVFLPALSFLFLLGKIEYHPKTDSLEYKVGEV